MNSPEIYSLFSKVVYINHIKNIDCTKIIKSIGNEFIKAVDNTKKDVNNISMSSISKNILEKKKYVFLKKIVLEQFNIFNKEVLKYKNNFRITNSWFTKVFPSQESNYHSHDNTMFSGVIYLQTNENSGDINFIDFSNHRYKLEVEEYNIYNSRDMSFKPVNGLIVIFPSDLNHKILTNNSSDIRYSLAFNLNPYGHINNKDCDSYLYIK